MSIPVVIEHVGVHLNRANREGGRMAVSTIWDEDKKMTLEQAEILVDSYTPERYARELPDELLYDLAKAQVLDERDIDRLS